MNTVKKNLTGWGLYPRAECLVQRPERYHQLNIGTGSAIPRGLGRSYGDAALNSEGHVILMERLNRFLSFDPSTGVLQLEAGVSLDDILKTFVPRGWFLPVTPGTKYVTVGGAIACDVHGKNHHVDGTFGKYVTVIDLLTADGSTKRCSPSQNASLFWATIGGMGLTGIIAQAAIQLIPISSAFIRVQHHVAKNLEAVLQILDDPAHNEKYSVAWIDCLATGSSLGRGIVMLGRHAEADECPKKVKKLLQIPPKKESHLAKIVPSWLLNKWSIKLFNEIYFSLQSRKTEPFTIDYDTFFYPLDRVEGWNTLYGKKGFVQYQFVIPFQNSLEALKKILNLLGEKRRPSYLAVLKRFGPQNPAPLSFPFEGYTLTLDIPITDQKVFPVLDQLDDLVLQYQGRVYLAKDARLNSQKFQLMYPRLREWLNIKKEIDPRNHFSSDLSRRLLLEAAS